MIVLGFDTATAATVVALLDSAARPEDWEEAREPRQDSAAGGRTGEDRPLQARELRHDPAPGERPGHAPRLLRLAYELLDAAGMTFADIDRIAVGLGPGGFTGLRIGVATARALAQAAGAELVGVSTLHALAAAARTDTGQGVLAVVDARRGEVFAGGWRDGERVLAPRAIAPAQVGTLGVAGWLAVGDGALRFRDDLEGAGCAIPVDGSALHGVSALTVCRLALDVRHPVERDLVVPDYLRKPDAVPSKP